MTSTAPSTGSSRRFWAAVTPGAVRRSAQSPLYRNGATLVVNAGITAVFGLVYWAVAARLTTPRLIGFNAALVSASVGLSTVATSGMNGALVTFIPRLGRKAPLTVFRVYLLSGAVSVLLGAGFCVIAPFITPSFRLLHGLGMAAYFTASVAVWSIFVLQDSVLIGLRHSGWVAVENGLYSVAKLVAVVLLVGTAVHAAIFVSWTFPAALALIPVELAIFLRFFRNREDRDAEPTLTHLSFGRYMGWDTLGTLFLQVSLAAMPILVVAELGTRAGGQFFIPWTLVTGLDLVAVYMGLSLTVEGARDAEETRPKMRRLMVEVLLVVGAAVICLEIAAPYILRLFGRGYSGASVTALRILLAASMFRVFNSLSIAWARAVLHVRRLVTTQIAMSVLPLGLAAVMMRSWGLTGASAAWLIGQALVAICSVPGFLRITRRRPIRHGRQPRGAERAAT